MSAGLVVSVPGFGRHPGVTALEGVRDRGRDVNGASARSNGADAPVDRRRALSVSVGRRRYIESLMSCATDLQ